MQSEGCYNSFKNCLFLYKKDGEKNILKRRKSQCA